MYKAVKCGCGDDICKHWHVTDVADVQGVSFTQAQAEAIASLLNGTLNVQLPAPGENVYISGVMVSHVIFP